MTARQDSRKQPRRVAQPAIDQVVMVPRVFGYARVSTDSQVLDVQLTALKAYGCDRIFQETVSARNAHRDEFHLLRKHVEKGDTIVVHAFSRLNRKLGDLLAFVEDMKALGVTLKSISEPHIDPYTSHGLMMLQMIGAVDENELNRTADRTRAAMQQKKAEGMYLGRPRLIDAADIKAMQRMRDDKVSPNKIAKKFGIAVSTVYANTKARAPQRRAS